MGNILVKKKKVTLVPFLLLEQLHQLVQNFFHFAPLKPTFSILHTHFYKTPTSVYLFCKIF